MAESFNESDEQVIAPLIQSSEIIDGAIKAVFEDGREDETVKHLKSFIARKESAIDDKCSYNHHAFYASVEELVEIQKEFRELKDDIALFNQRLQNTGSEMLNQADALVRKRAIRTNIEGAIESIRKCRLCMVTATKAYHQIAENSLYPALKTIRELEKQLTGIAEFKVGIVLQQRIPVLVQVIIQKVFDGFCEWAEPETNLDMAHMIGEKHMDLARLKIEDPSATQIIEDAEDDLPIADDLPGMKKVSLCCHVMEALQSHEKFRRCYIETRMAMFHNHMKLDNPRGRFIKRHEIQWELYLTSICGVFVIEDQIMHSYAEQFTSRVDTVEMWSGVQERLLEELESKIGLMSAEQHLELAELTAAFATAMHSVGFECDQLLQFVNGSSGQFKSKLAQKLEEEFTAYASKSNLQSTRVQSEHDFRSAIEATMYSPPGYNSTRRPQLPFEFAFSRSFIHLCDESKQFMEQFGAMSQEDDDVFDEKEIIDCLSTYTNCIRDALSAALNPAFTQAATAVQIYIDISYLIQKFAPQCEAVWLVDKCGASPDRPASTLVPMLAPLHEQATELLCESIQHHVQQLLAPASAQIPWDAEEIDSKAALTPSPFVEKLQQYFVTEVFVNLNRLEADRSGLKSSDVDRDRKEVETQIFTALNDGFLELIQTQEKLTIVAVKAISRDLNEIIESVNTHSKLRTLKIRDCFAGGLLMCKLLTEPGEIVAIRDSGHKESVYSKLSDSLLLSILLKFEAGLKGGLFDTDEQKDVKATIKALKK